MKGVCQTGRNISISVAEMQTHAARWDSRSSRALRAGQGACSEGAQRNRTKCAGENSIKSPGCLIRDGECRLELASNQKCFHGGGNGGGQRGYNSIMEKHGYNR